MTRPRLRPYQVDDQHKIDAAFVGARRVAYQAPTGCGKTILFVEHIHREVAAGGRVVVLGHRDEIVQQISGALGALGLRHGIIAPGYAETSDRVQVASVMTLVRRLHRLRRPPSLLVIDEAHHAVAASWQRVIDELPEARILGVTATPRRLDGKPLDDVFERLVVGPSIASLIEQGFLAPATVYAPTRSPDLSGVSVRAGDYAIDQLHGVMANGMIVSGAVDEYQRLCPDAPALAFCVDIAHSQLVTDAFRRRGYRAEHVDGETPRQQRRELIAALGDGDIDILTNCGLISEGLDVPGVVAAVLLRPTKSLALYLQMVGRALRPAPDKDCAFILDHAGNVFRHGLPTAQRQWSLHGREPRNDYSEQLRRCPLCGAINARNAAACDACGAELQRPRAPRVEVAGPRLTVAAPPSDADLAAMSYKSCLLWAAGSDGRLQRDRLERLAIARGYTAGWVWHQTGKHFEEALTEMRRWREQQVG
jgi:superfamily II DNA or RNA helicase